MFLITVSRSERYVIKLKAQFVRVSKQVKGIARFFAGYVILLLKTSTCQVEVSASNITHYPSLSKHADMIQDICVYTILGSTGYCQSTSRGSLSSP